MIYIFETEILNSKSVQFSLKKIYGLNTFQINSICKKLGFSANLKTSKLATDQIFTLKKLVEIKSYSGLRRIKGLPVRGQRTHTNARTAKSRSRFK
jgi:small subunit ribosomal protein S13